MKKSAEARRVNALKRKAARAVLKLLAQMTDGELLRVKSKLYRDVSSAINDEGEQLAFKKIREDSERNFERWRSGQCIGCGEALPEEDRVRCSLLDYENTPSGKLMCEFCKSP